MHLPFRLAIAPRQLESGFDCGVVLLERSGKARTNRNLAGGCIGEPFIKQVSTMFSNDGSVIKRATMSQR